MLKLIDRYIIKELIFPFIFGVAAFTTILVAGSLLFELAKLIINQGVPLRVVIKLFFYNLPGFVVLTFPMSMLLSVLLGFGRLTSDGEMLAFRSLGVSFWRIMLPVVIASLYVAGLSFAFNETVVPKTKLAAQNVMRIEVRREVRVPMKQNVFFRQEVNGKLKRVLYIEKVLPGKDVVEKVFIQEFNPKGMLCKIIVAKRAIVGGEYWTFENGVVYNISEAGVITSVVKFAREKAFMGVSAQKIAEKGKDPELMNIVEISKYIDFMKQQGLDPRELEITYHQRMAIPLASLVFVLIGAPLALKPHRSSSSIGLGISIIIIFIYYVMLSTFKAFGEGGHLSPFLAAWLPNIILGGLGVYLIHRANTFSK